MARPDKTADVAEIADAFRDSSAAVLTDYRGLTVAQITALRRSMGTTTRYAVVKNTLTRIAARDAGVTGIDDLLVGPTAVAFVSGDPVEAAKSLRDFARTNPALIVKGGVLAGSFLSADEIRRLADLESREVLLSRMAGALQGSLAQAVSLFAAPLSQFARLSEALRQKAEADPSVLRGGAGEPADNAPEPTVENTSDAPALAAVVAPDGIATEASAAPEVAQAPEVVQAPEVAEAPDVAEAVAAPEALAAPDEAPVPTDATDQTI